MSGYEEQELTAIDAALDANPDATSNEVFQATRPYDERAIASAAASRALAGGGGSSAATLINHGSGDGIRGDQVIVPCDNANHAVSLAGVEDPPSWLAADGTIVEAGLYQFSLACSVWTPLTSTGKFVRLLTPFAADYVAPIDGLALGPIAVADVATITPSDLPFDTSNSQARASTDATGALACTPFLTKLADATT